MRGPTAGSYVCWRCLSRGLQPRPVLGRRPGSATGSHSLATTALRVQGAIAASRRGFASVQEEQTSDEDPVVPLARTPIRERLRQWQAENPVTIPRGMPDDTGQGADTRNLFTRARNFDELQLDAQEANPSFNQLFPEGEELPDLPAPSSIKAGDLLECIAVLGDKMAVFAVCLGYIDGLYHLYTMTGKWFSAPKIDSLFVVDNFVSKQEIQPVIDQLPKEKLTREELKQMQDMKLGPDRVAGAAILQKMNEFKQSVDEVTQKYGIQLEDVHAAIVTKEARYLTLRQIQAYLLPKEKPYPALLYAVHRAVMNDDVGFRLVSTLGNERNWLFEVAPPEDVALVKNMQTLVRQFTDLPAQLDTSLSSLTPNELSTSQLGRFILKARRAIEQSRHQRDWTPHGMLGPYKRSMKHDATTWTDLDTGFLYFLHIWASYDQFSPSSSLHWMGSAILRATGMYKDSEYLSTTTGWTFLQEVGYLTPWDIRARYIKRLPDVEVSRRSGFEPLELGPLGVRPYLTEDVFAGKRHDWGNLTAFAIDSKETSDVDDAISVEATDVPGEHWVHIHVADPASRIRPQCALADRAQLTPMTLYLQGHYSNMWGVGNEVQELFSLAPGKPCLTFSGRVNERGDLLDWKITPAKLQNLVYMTPQDANAVTGQTNNKEIPEWSTADSFTVGEVPAEKAATRQMTTPAELLPEDAGSLRTLHRIGDALRQKRLDKGAMPFFPPKTVSKANFDKTSVQTGRLGLMACSGDPAITIYWDIVESFVVSNTMTLAGEIAARWAAERNVPVPYASTPQAADNLPLLKAYVQKVHYPALRLMTKTPDPHTDRLSHLHALLGPHVLTTTPGMQFLIGADSYVKVTSPLRRYSDLLAHWQIESALAQEMAAGKVVEQELPFSRHELEHDVLPWILLRQRIIRNVGDVQGTRAYMLQALLRAWKYPTSPAGAGDRLPERFKLTTTQSAMRLSGSVKQSVPGRLDWFGLDVVLSIEGLAQLGVKAAEVRRGDVFEVKLVDVNVYLGEVIVEATAKLSMEKDRLLSQAGAAEVLRGEAEEEQEYPSA